MGHVFDPANFAKLDDPARLQWLAPRTIVELVAPRDDEIVVDYGAGTGALTLPLAEAVTRGQVVAVDLSAELLERLRSKLDERPDLSARVRLVHTADDRVPLADGEAGAVLTVNVWHEIADQASSLAEIGRLLGPGSRLVIVDWAPIERPVGPPADHVLSSDEAVRLVEGMGLTVTSVHEAGDLLQYSYAIVATKA